jgi:Aldehyde:ferredoxin oxidoreductase
LPWYGYKGRVLRVNLTSQRASVEELRLDYVKLYIGGLGYAARVLWDELRPGVDPLSPDNVLIATTGPMTGTLAPGSATSTGPSSRLRRAPGERRGQRQVRGLAQVQRLRHDCDNWQAQSPFTSTLRAAGLRSEREEVLGDDRS